MPFAFLELPAELRNRIYKLCAECEEPIKVHRVENKKDGNFAALTRICRQIRSEYIEIQRQEARVIISWSDLNCWSTVMVDESRPSKELRINISEDDMNYGGVDIVKLFWLRDSPDSKIISSIIYTEECLTLIQRPR